MNSLARSLPGDAVVLVSGGQDSVTALAWAKKVQGGSSLRPVAFDYGQRHSAEVRYAVKAVRELALEPLKVLPLELLPRLAGSPMTDSSVTVPDADSRFGWPETFVPGRNLLFVAAAAAFAGVHGLRDIVIGVRDAGSPKYPDHRRRFLRAVQTAARAATGLPIRVHAPLLQMSKCEVFALAHELGVLDLVLEDTRTCYRGAQTERDRHPWGYGCGRCLACRDREAGWRAFSDVVLEERAVTCA